MASLKEIKGRINSIQSTQKITSAMRMVASAKLHHTQGMNENFLRYMNSLHSIMDSLRSNENYQNQQETLALSNTTQQEETSSYSNKTPQSNSIALITISSNSGLCGAFNSNIAKATFKEIESLKNEYDKIILIPIGKKIAQELKKENISYNPDFIDLADNAIKEDGFNAIIKLANLLNTLHSNGEIQEAIILSHHFKSMGSQIITKKTLELSNAAHTRNTQSKQQDQKNLLDSTSEFLTEPSQQELINSLHPQLINAELYGTILDSLTSEHASRMLAMQTADDNANDLLKELTLLYNKTRQQAITNELIDIMGGKTE